MVDSRYPNRWFGSNPQAIPNHGKKLTEWNRELPKDWRSALELDPDATAAKGEHAESDGDAAA